MRFIELSNDLRKIVSTPVLDKTTQNNTPEQHNQVTVSTCCNELE